MRSWGPQFPLQKKEWGLFVRCLGVFCTGDWTSLLHLQQKTWLYTAQHRLYVPGVSQFYVRAVGSSLCFYSETGLGKTLEAAAIERDCKT